MLIAVSRRELHSRNGPICDATDPHFGNGPVFDATIERLKCLPRLRYLDLCGSDITDNQLSCLDELREVRALCLTLDDRITDSGLGHLEGHIALERLDLAHTHITDAGLAHLSKLTHLRVLCLSLTEITDAGLEHLTGLSELSDLDLGGTPITDVGLCRLKVLTKLKKLRVFPNITIAGIRESEEGTSRMRSPVLALREKDG